MAGWAWVGKGADVPLLPIQPLQFSDIIQKKVSLLSDIEIF